jgi:adenine-specific DNA methylase
LENSLLSQTVNFPSTRYQGSKSKLIKWIWQSISNEHFTTTLDVFGGTGVVSYLFKAQGKRVVYNDLLKFNYINALALIENKNILLTDEETNWLLKKHSFIDYPNFIENTFSNIYFTDEENILIDQLITNIGYLDNKYKFAIAFFALCQACIIKRPYNLFHRKNLYIRLADVKRSFGNKKAWDRPIDKWFCDFVKEANNAVFDNEQINIACNQNALNLNGGYDLVYIDPPYISAKGSVTNYLEFYHFLEGLANYSNWHNKIDFSSKHRRFVPEVNQWTKKMEIFSAFEEVFKMYRKSILVVSYRSDGIPSECDLIGLMRKYKSSVRVEYYGKYKYALSTNSDSKEILLIGT